MISIVIPVYNQSKKLDRCLSSIAKQSYDNYEIIIINDRSTQRLGWVIGKHRNVFGIKMEIVNNQTNHGAPYSRNKGFRRAKGEFVIFCDADVVMRDDMLATLVKRLRERKDLSYVYSSHKFGRKKFGNLEWSEQRLRQMPFIHTTALIRKDDFPKSGFDESLKRLQDWDLWLTMLEEGKRGEWINRTLFYVEPGGTMSNWMPSFFYKLFPFLPKVRKYKKAVEIVKKKHNLI